MGLQFAIRTVARRRPSIDARPESPQSFEMMRGPMLQALLEDRFKLRIHRSTRQVPIYALVVAKGGPKHRLAAPFSPDGKGGTSTYGQTLAGISAEFSALLDTRVDDRTGIEGIFDIHLDVGFSGLFTRFDHRPAAGDTPEPPGTDPREAFRGRFKSSA